MNRWDARSVAVDRSAQGHATADPSPARPDTARYTGSFIASPPTKEILRPPAPWRARRTSAPVVEDPPHTTTPHRALETAPATRSEPVSVASVGHRRTTSEVVEAATAPRSDLDPELPSPSTHAPRRGDGIESTNAAIARPSIVTSATVRRQVVHPRLDRFGPRGDSVSVGRPPRSRRSPAADCSRSVQEGAPMAPTKAGSDTISRAAVAAVAASPPVSTLISSTETGRPSPSAAVSNASFAPWNAGADRTAASSDDRSSRNAIFRFTWGRDTEGEAPGSPGSPLVQPARAINARPMRNGGLRALVEAGVIANLRMSFECMSARPGSLGVDRVCQYPPVRSFEVSRPDLRDAPWTSVRSCLPADS